MKIIQEEKMKNDIETLKQYIINKDFEKAKNIINDSNFDLYLYENIKILFILSINNNFNYLFDKYLEYFKLNSKQEYLINYGISLSIESSNIYAFENLINNSNLDDTEVSQHILSLSCFFGNDIYTNMFNILIQKYPSFHLFFLTAIIIIVESKNYYFFNKLIQHMKNFSEINNNWIETHITNQKEQENIKKIIKINIF